MDQRDRAINIPLISNGYTLSRTPARLGFLTPSDPAQPAARLWEQFQEQGFLWLKGILDRRAVLDFRRRFFCALAPTGLLDPGSDEESGVYAGGGEDRQAAQQMLIQAAGWPEFEALCHARPILQFYQAALGGPVALHRRRTLAYYRPGDPNCLPAHIDLTALRAGTTRVYTTWIPIGDTPVEMGGMVYLRGSHALAQNMEADFAAAYGGLDSEEYFGAFQRHMTETGWATKDLPFLAERMDAPWLAADYEAGDMVIQSPFIIHASTENRDPLRRLRLSTDIRCQLATDAGDARWAGEWLPASPV